MTDYWGLLRHYMHGDGKYRFECAKIVLQAAMNNQSPELEGLIHYYSDFRDNDPEAVSWDEINGYQLKNSTLEDKNSSIHYIVNTGFRWGYGPSELVNILIEDFKTGQAYTRKINTLVITPELISTNSLTDLKWAANDLASIFPNIKVITSTEDLEDLGDLRDWFPKAEIELVAWGGRKRKVNLLRSDE